ncbi:hypothetical protein TBLA_0H01450 [Henningerozyma blattae CBS 6284]|uniref:Transmembrane 9 superfamily member n=1 Tax=Henningerozyma blattae (strain ATCC 34711 / CBS 6284 / DSM 70876 / NBRC 10599 / NRRL Y-10934 / UCD 77-7) TaxID=1071380 RepID=I2H7T0_HENB6|nr:hypothetical protein TBLA_0H01450 [Tetrapisispora blattae CBS 6284]CCH62432.1 hypothetical protein TBLA_0H01450 [Tetrapisispora blattae CBS 6284]
MNSLLTSILCLISFHIIFSNAFYIPGISANTYHPGDPIELEVNRLTPSMYFEHTDENGQSVANDKEHFLYSYDYYYDKFHFCRPEKVERKSESLGSVLFGDRIYNSPFELYMLEPKECVPLCKTTIPADDAKFINKLIKNGFFYNWLIDGLPSARKIYDSKTESIFYSSGFPLGSVSVEHMSGGSKVTIPGVSKLVNEAVKAYKKREAKNVPAGLITAEEVEYFANHFNIHIEYHDRGNNNYRVVGVTVDPISIKRDDFESCTPTGNQLHLNENAENQVLFTYSVDFIKSETAWATRWDKYLHTYDPSIQWFSLINFTIVVVLLSTIVIHALLRALKKDISRYTDLNLDNSFTEDSGWKLTHGDVFRMPRKAMVLSIYVGSGVQLFLMILCCLTVAALGFMSPSYRGALPTCMFVLYAIFGFVGSYTSMGVYKFFHGPYWKANMILTPLLVPGSMLLLIIFLNFFLLGVHSSGTIPASTIILMICLWLLVSVPLSFLGSFVAFKKCNWNDNPTTVNEIPREIPIQPWYMRSIPVVLLSGIVPFGAIAVELYFIYSSLWYNKIFYMFGFLLVSFILMIFTSVLVSIIVVYHSLCLENWRWQWRSFVAGGLGCAFYIFLYSIAFTRFKFTGFVSILLYMGYSSLICVVSCLITGAVSFMCNMFFVKRIFTSIKVH